MSERKAAIYGNYTITGPDNQPMFRCDKKRFEWYRGRDLIDVTEEFTGRLKFLPKGMGVKEKPHLLVARENICAVCGLEEPLLLTRHHVVPRMYRKAFPSAYKDHNHYDILPMCRECHNEYEFYADIFKVELCIQYGVRTSASPTDEAKRKFDACKAASTLQNFGHLIPDERKTSLLYRIALHLQRTPTKDDIEHLASLSLKKQLTDQEQGKLVVERLTDIDAFVKQWRAHFVEKMQPKFLPEDWIKHSGISK